MARLSRVAPEIPVSDLQQSIEYYEVKLGFRLAMITQDRRYAIVERDDVALHLFEDGDPSRSPVGLHIFTHDLDELHTELLRRGAQMLQQIIKQPWGNRDFRVRDRSGNEIKFTEPASDA